jgi:hypothetical protein
MRQKKFLFIMILFILAVAPLLISCGGGAIGGQVKGESFRYSEDNRPASSSRAKKAQEPKGGAEKEDKADLDQPESEPGTSANPREDEAVIIYEADCDVSVRSVKDSVVLIGKLASDAGGYIESNTSSDSYRSAFITVRVPVAKFDSFLADITKIGRVNRKDIKATNVSDEYRDLSVKLASAEKVRDRLIALLRKEIVVSEKIKILREIDRINAGIESVKARINYLKGLADYSTVRIALHSERQDTVKRYLPSPFSWIRDLSFERRSIFKKYSVRLSRPEGYFSLESDFADKGSFLFALPGEGTVVRAGVADNYPKMNSAFWKEAFMNDALRRLNTVVETKEIRIKDGSIFHLFHFIVSGGKYYSVAVNVSDSEIFIIEAVYTDKDMFASQKSTIETLVSASGGAR